MFFPCYAKKVLIDKKITLSGLIMEMFDILSEDYVYEHFVHDNSLLVRCRDHLITCFVFDPSLCLHYYNRRHFVFFNTIGCKTHPKGYKIIKCYVCYRRSLLQVKRGFLCFLI